MGLLKDAWDILKDEPKVREWLSDNAVDAYHYLKPKVLAVFPREANRSEAIRRSSTIFDAIVQPEFSNSFSSRLAFLEFLFVNIVNAVDSKERGIVLRNFYIPNKMVYFPLDYQRKELVRKTFTLESHTCLLIKRRTLFEKRYRLYIIDGEYSIETDQDRILSAFDASLGATSSESEADRFRNTLAEQSLSLDPVDSLYFFPNNQVFGFARYEMLLKAEKIKHIMAFVNTDSTRMCVCEDVQEFLKKSTM